jgi:hypothetical protein
VRPLLAGALAVTLASSAVFAAGCSGSVEHEPLTLEGNLLTVDNRTDQAWNDVEIWLNYYYRVTAKSIPAGGRFQAPLDTFVESRGGRFNFKRQQITDLRLKARAPDGSPIEIVKQFQRTGLDRLGERR